MIFNEDKLQAEIIKTWGEFGVHNEVFQAMRKKISDKKQLTLTDVGGMFSEEKMEQAWTDGAGCGESRSGYFDIENYR
jgi:hypothetical protein|tara:strand:+ start:201 stop:434 length:234 start_codon:yes stop_codon:yes gene_type:complete